MRSRHRLSSVIAVTLLGVVTSAPEAVAGPFTPDQDAQRRAAQQLAPSDLMLPAPAQRPTTTAVVRVRFYADDDYRAGLFRWADRTKMQLQFVNKVLEPAFGVRFEAESFRRWHRSGGNIDVYQMLAELEKQDPGQDVDWVVAYVAPLPLISTSIHEIGAARLLGRHFLMRGMASADEAAMFGKNFDQLDRAERENLYSIRKFHKETTIFIHEWLHTLGGMHSNDRQRINHASYSNKMSNLAPIDAELAAAALHDRLTVKTGTPVDWSGLRTAVERASSPEWAPKERDELLALLRSTGAQIAKAPKLGPARGDLPGDDGEKLNHAIGLMKAGKAKEAWAEVQPLGAKHPKNADVQRLVCRLGYLPSSKEEGTAACARARELEPKLPEPLIDAAQALVLRKDSKGALAAVEEAADRARKVTKGKDAVWVWISQIYAQLGALTKAEEALALAPENASGLDKARADLQFDRRRLGLPSGGLPSTEAEIDYAERYRKASMLVDANKPGQARAAVDAARKDYPAVPGLEVLSCEVDMRQGRVKQGEKACAHALSVMNDLPRAHYLLGHAQLQTGARDAAAESLRRAIELDPKEAAPYQTLAQLYRFSGKKQQLASLKVEYEKVFSKPLK